MAKQTHLCEAKKKRDDEFYTLFESIEIELKRYRAFFQGKIIYLPCDNLSSNFWLYFSLNFKFFGLKGLIATSYSSSERVFKYTLKAYGEEPLKERLVGNGDFRSDECRALMSYCDTIVTNPPYSLFKEFIAQCVESENDYVVIGSVLMPTQNKVFSLLKDKKLFIGVSSPKRFKRPNGEFKTQTSLWYSTFNVRKNPPLLCYKEYSEEEFPTYANYDAININKFVEVPKEYYGVMGVPVSALEKLNYEQFTIVGILKGGSKLNYTREGKLTRVDSFGDIKLTGGKKSSTKINGIPFLKWNSKTKKSIGYLDEETGDYFVGIFPRLLIKRNPNFKEGE